MGIHPAMNQAIRYLVISQAAFFLFSAVSIGLAPGSLRVNDGLSYLGYHRASIVPFFLGLGIAAYFLIRAADALQSLRAPVPRLAHALQLVAVLIPLVLLTPSDVHGFVHLSHMVVSGAVFVIELGISVWLTFRVRSDPANVALLVAQFASGIVALVSLPDILRLMLLSQLSFQLAFGIILIRTLPRLARR